MRNISLIFILFSVFIFLAACDNSSENCNGVCLDSYFSDRSCNKSFVKNLSTTSGTGADVRISSEKLNIFLVHKNAYFYCSVGGADGGILANLDYNAETKTIKLSEKGVYKWATSCTCAYEIDFVVKVPDYGKYKVEIWKKPDESVYNPQDHLVWSNEITVDDTGAKFADSDELPFENWDY